MKLSNSEQWTDFQGCFWSYVRINGADVNDTRQQTLELYCNLPSEEIIGHSQASDLAVILSNAVKAAKPHDIISAKAMLSDDKVVEIFQDRPLLIARPGHSVSMLLGALLQTQEGCALYLQVACILSDAAADDEFAAYLYS